MHPSPIILQHGKKKSTSKNPKMNARENLDKYQKFVDKIQMNTLYFKFIKDHESEQSKNSHRLGPRESFLLPCSYQLLPTTSLPRPCPAVYLGSHPNIFSLCLQMNLDSILVYPVVDSEKNITKHVKKENIRKRNICFLLETWWM